MVMLNSYADMFLISKTGKSPLNFLDPCLISLALNQSSYVCKIFYFFYYFLINQFFTSY
jgi:hypothetical protein